jgi:NADPH:quinone reductase-like Zn-dependent oxidoreductase
MKAVRIHAYGGLDVLSYEEAPCPDVGEDDVLLRVHATAVNPVDCLVRAGYLTAYFNHTLPLILGWDVSGVIEAIGSAVTNLAVGDAVFARADMARDGACAEYIAVRASDVVAKPASLDHVQAAAIPLAGLAAWKSLIDTAGVTEGQKVLIHRAAGGVGTFAVQLAKWRGAHVIGTASRYNLDFLRELGADEVIDYNTTRFEEVVNDVDVVLDTLGGDVQVRCWPVLKPGGMLVSIMEPPSEETAAAHGVRHGFIGVYPDPKTMQEIAALVEAGHIKPIVSTVLPLQEARQAHALSESMHTRGKIVLQVME